MVRVPIEDHYKLEIKRRVSWGGTSWPGKRIDASYQEWILVRGSIVGSNAMQEIKEQINAF